MRPSEQFYYVAYDCHLEDGCHISMKTIGVFHYTVRNSVNFPRVLADEQSRRTSRRHRRHEGAKLMETGLHTLDIATDAEHVVMGATEWFQPWLNNGWVSWKRHR